MAEDNESKIQEIQPLQDNPSNMSGPANQQGGQQLVQQFNIEDHALHRKINEIRVNLRDMSSLVNQEGGNQLVEQFIPFFNKFNAEFRKLNTQLQQKPSVNQSTSEERLELSELDMKILDDPAMENLQVSYDYLQRTNLKYCLVFLSIFPENAVIRKRPLIYWWIGEGLISTEEKGKEIFEELLKLGLIIPYGNGKNPFVSKCRIHPWIRYLLISLAKNAELLNCDSNRVPRFDIKNSKRAYLEADDENLPQTELNLRTNISNVSELPYLRTSLGTDDENLRSTNSSHKSESTNYLRTIFNVNQSYVSFKSEFLRKQKKLAVLMLGRWQDLSTHHIEVENELRLKELRTQKHLKYLSLRGISRITALPDSILELTCLEILDLKACHNLETLPDDISPLKKLTHLDVSECYLLESMPKGLDKLTSLEVLKGFVIGNSKKTPCRIDDLKKLNKLKRFSIHIGSKL